MNILITETAKNDDFNVTIILSSFDVKMGTILVVSKQNTVELESGTRLG